MASIFPTWEEIGDVVGGVVEGAEKIWEQSGAAEQYQQLEEFQQMGRQVPTAQPTPQPASSEKAGDNLFYLLAGGIALYLILKG